MRFLAMMILAVCVRLQKRLFTADELTPVGLLTSAELIAELQRRNAAVVVRTARIERITGEQTHMTLNIC